MDLSRSYLAGTTRHPLNIEIDSASGSYLHTKSGQKILDFISGIGVNCIGHSHPRVVNALKQQIDEHLHTMVYGEFIQNTQVEYAELLCSLLPPIFDKVYFTNSGTEANEGALKTAKRYTGRSELISFQNSYHGSTHGSLSVSGNENRKRAFRPLLPDIKFLEFNNTGQLNRITNKTAAVITEPIQGDAGVIIPDMEFMAALRNRCSETGAILIFDEVQTGFGRTGKLFAFEHFNIVPDILTLGKALGGGLPLGAFVSSGEILDSITYNPPLGHITTYGGNPLSCASGKATLQVIRDDKLVEKSVDKGKYIHSLLKGLLPIEEIRSKGLMFGIDLQNEKQTEILVKEGLKKGLLLFWFLSRRSSFRIAPPLTISNTEIEEGCEIIKSVFQDYSAFS